MPAWRVPRNSADDRQIKAIIDIDCAELDGFDEGDKEQLEKLAKLLADSCDFWSFKADLTGALDKLEI